MPDHWVWDFWFATESDRVHLFFLHAPKSLGDPELRHQAARIGHATSTDLTTWTLMERPLPEPVEGARDDRATWTGSVVRDDDGRWHLFYTGVCSSEDGQVQRILSAVSDDLEHWCRTETLVEADPQWYERWSPELPEEHWRDPWVHREGPGKWRMYLTARCAGGPLDGRGVIATATSTDLVNWEVHGPVTKPGELRQLEVPQLIELEHGWAMMFCADQRDHSRARRARLSAGGLAEQSGTHVLYSQSVEGPFEWEDDRFFDAVPPARYAGRVLRWRDRLHYFAWCPGAAGAFEGFISGPHSLGFDSDGRLCLDWSSGLGESSGPVSGDLDPVSSTGSS